ncbi:DUF397 domain-containing protein [Allonocardiopsis opalescens]|uniref:Uncharacterized protein DUF397 n=1 Tax=Allonocardiopsis opalescens TaxID=1144618 RepID=A0A2T0PW39_9ACTN|nr:DUF397 domain-containing protein [Allonocardiopsis opalescens]PRX95755.1 uncharacterized protein DUF397 [Allonocardiopsis opalescens]
MITEWHKSSYSSGGSNCVEFRESENCADVRDSKHPEQPHLSFSPDAWTTFTQAVKDDRL